MRTPCRGRFHHSQKLTARPAEGFRGSASPQLQAYPGLCFPALLYAHRLQLLGLCGAEGQTFQLLPEIWTLPACLMRLLDYAPGFVGSSGGTNGDILLRDEQLRQERHGCEFAGCVIERCTRPIGKCTIVDAILDQIVHNAYSIELTGNSMRRAVQLPPLPGATATPAGGSPRPPATLRAPPARSPSLNPEPASLTLGRGGFPARLFPQTQDWRCRTNTRTRCVYYRRRGRGPSARLTLPNNRLVLCQARRTFCVNESRIGWRTTLVHRKL